MYNFCICWKGCDYKMIKIKWIITDNLSNISLDEFDNEWNGIISGYFELVINQRKEGFCPQRIIHVDEEGIEDVLYWLSHLLEAITVIKKGTKYEMTLLTMNLYKIVIVLNENVKISFVNVNSDVAKWQEEITLQEFEKEIYKNVDNFLQSIEKVNSMLLESKWISRLLDCGGNMNQQG